MITFILSNFTLTFLILGLIFSGIAIARAPKPLALNVIVEKLLSWYVFFSVGVCYLYNAIVHIILREDGGSIHRLGRQPFPVRGGHRKPRLFNHWVYRCVPQLRSPARCGDSLQHLHPRRRRWPCARDDHVRQFRAGQCRRDLLHRFGNPGVRAAAAMAAVAVRSAGWGKIGVTRDMPAESLGGVVTHQFGRYWRHSGHSAKVEGAPT